MSFNGDYYLQMVTDKSRMIVGAAPYCFFSPPSLVFGISTNIIGAGKGILVTDTQPETSFIDWRISNQQDLLTL